MIKYKKIQCCQLFNKDFDYISILSINSSWQDFFKKFRPLNTYN